jgi:hypothetical protein
MKTDQVDGSGLKVEASQYVLKNGDRQPDAWTGQTGQAGVGRIEMTPDIPDPNNRCGG